MREKYIASCSFGKDSLAMVLRLIEENKPLDEVVFYDTGMEFKAIYDIRDSMREFLASHDVKFVNLIPPYKFEYKAFEKPVIERGGGQHLGYSWCGGRCRWGTTDKLVQMDRYAKEQNAFVYIGIASDEYERLAKERAEYKLFPLSEWGMTENDCLKYCYEHGYEWIENGIRLYDILDRVSCWCCANKNRKELYNMFCYLPEYWQKLKDFQARTDRPMKNWHNKKYGCYGNVFAMEKVFEQELKEKNERFHRGLREGSDADDI